MYSVLITELSLVINICKTEIGHDMRSSVRSHREKKPILQKEKSQTLEILTARKAFDILPKHVNKERNLNLKAFPYF